MTQLQDNAQLIQIIQDRITNAPQQRITFAEYMDLVLYHPQQGYYSSGIVEIGKEGDFFTASSLGSDFGELLAEQFVEMWEKLEKPTQFDLVEMGAGKGQLANDILNYLSQHYSQFLEALHYRIIETSSALKQEQQNLLKTWQEKGLKMTWETWEELADASLVGCCFSNELVDAFPVHRVQIEDGTLKEVYVTLGENTSPFTEITDELSTSQLREYFQTVGVSIPTSAYPDQFQTEVNLAVIPWLKTISRCLQKGYLLTIDYGYTADRYYNPQRYSGTLQCYTQHQRNNDPYYLIGQQDITAHIDFTALETYGKQYNLEPLALTKQALFLMALGLGDRLNELSQGGFNAMQILQRRDALHQLIDPMGLGGFGVLLQGKGLTSEEMASPLRGFREDELT
jgi:SAM-dependent MidA family methyltransferase